LVAQSFRQKQREEPKLEIKSEDKRLLLDQIKNKSFEDSQKIVSQTLDLEIKSLDRKVVQKDASVRMEATLSKEQMEMYHQVKSLISHINPSATFAQVFEHLAKDYLKRKGSLVNDQLKTPTLPGTTDRLVAPTRNKSATTERSNTWTVSNPKQKSTPDPISITDSVMKYSETKQVQQATIATTPKRTPIPMKIKRYVWHRDQGKCQYKVHETGKTCGSPYQLEVDHIKRVRHGGDNDPRNLQLLCHSHNLLRG
jgi:hypothetical protein